MTATKPTERAAPVPGSARPTQSSRTETVLLALCAALALALALSSPPGVPQQIWGGCAAVGYAAAALAAVRSARRWAPSTAVVAAVGTVVVPFVVLVVLDRAQMEVGVVERAGDLLLDTGSPYSEDPVRVSDFNPYLPGMALFGLPHALFGEVPGAGLLAGPRWWFALCFLGTMVGAARVAGIGRRTRRAVALVTVCPAVALPLAIGGVDPPVVGMACLGLAYAGRGDAGRAGLALGLAAALKWTAWPALPVVFALLAARRGGRAALRCALSTAAVLALVCAPVVVAGARACVQHVVLYPLGLADGPSSAASPLPGHLLATYVPHGTAVTLAALALAAVLMAASLVLRPPRTAWVAADRIALGLILAMLLAPASRSGYLIYPLLLFVWFRIAALYGDEAVTPVRASAACRYGRVLWARGTRGPVRPECLRGAEASCRRPRSVRGAGELAGCGCPERGCREGRTAYASASPVRTVRGRRPR